MHPLYRTPLFLFLLLAAELTQASAGFATANRVPTLKLPKSNGEVLAQTAEDRKAEADRLSAEALQLWRTSQFQAAIANLQEALEIYRELGVREAFPQESRQKEGETLLSFGAVHADMGQYETAIEFFQQALFIHQEVGNRTMEGTTLNNLGVVYRKISKAHVL